MCLRFSNVFFNILILIIISCPSVTIGWELKKSIRDIDIYYRKIEREGVFYTEFKAITNIDTNLSTLATVLRDVGAMQEWVYMVESAEAIKVNELERYTHIINKKPFPFFYRRDSVVHSTIQQNKTTLIVTIEGKSTPDKFWKRMDGVVRIENGESMWQFIPIDENKTKVVFQGYRDPGGNLDVFAIKKLVQYELWKMPYESLLNLKTQVKKEKYSTSRTPFIFNYDSNKSK